MSRLPFDLPSGCGEVSVPAIDVVSVCSLPPITVPGASPKPVAFNIPQLPNPGVEQACIDIRPIFSARFEKVSVSGSPAPTEPSARASFRTLTGFTDCLEGRYAMSVRIRVPCVLSAFMTAGDPSAHTGKWAPPTGPSAATFPKIGVAIRPNSGQDCAVGALSFQLRIPCPVPTAATFAVRPSVVQFPRSGEDPRSGLSVGKLVLRRRTNGGCAFSGVSLRLKVPAGCAGLTLPTPECLVTRVTSLDQMTMHLSFSRKNPDKITGVNPDACNFGLKLSVWLPVISVNGTGPVVAYPSRGRLGFRIRMSGLSTCERYLMDFDWVPWEGLYAYWGRKCYHNGVLQTESAFTRELVFPVRVCG